MRKAFWILLMLATPALVLAQEAQQTQQKPPEKPAAEAQKAPEQPQPAAKPRSPYPPAPKPGHPLDPADVDVLTGKNKPANPYGPYGYRIIADPYSGFGYPMGSTLSGPSVFSTPGGSMLSGTPQVGFGTVGGRRFFFVNGSQAGLPILYFNRGSDRVFVFLGRGLSFF